MAFDERFLSELRMKNEITDVVSAYVNLSKRQGRIRKGLCPFHNEKTASFAVYEDTQSFYCFGCGVGGDVVNFIMNIDNLDYVEAVRKLAQRANIPLPAEGFDDSVVKRKKRIYEANKLAAKFFYECLTDEKNRFALEYYLGRGISPATIRHFGLGYAPDSWDSLKKYMNEQGFSNQELFSADLLKKSEKNGRTSYYDNFRNRMMTPIIDVRGNIIGFGGRVLDNSKPKYVNTADTLVYKKSHEVFALNFAKNGNPEELIVAEGYMDVIALHQAGFTNAVACLGTATTKDQALLIRKYVDRVVLSYDSDEAGQKATARAIGIFSEAGLSVRVLKLEGGKDPDEIIKKHGKERFEMLLKGAQNNIEYEILKIKEKYNVDTDDGKAGFVTEVTGYLATLDNPVRRDTYVSRLSNETGIDKTSIIQLMNTLVKKRVRAEKAKSFENARRSSLALNDKINPELKNNLRGGRAEENLLTLLLRNPDFWESIRDKTGEDDFSTTFNKRVFKALAKFLDDGEDISLSLFTPHFSPEEMGRISSLFNRWEMVSNTKKECLDCIAVMKQEKAKQNSPDISSLSDEEFAKLISDLGKK